VVQFGTPSKEHSSEETLVMMNYRARWTDAQSKVVFESRIEEEVDEESNQHRPSYNVYVIDTAEEGNSTKKLLDQGRREAEARLEEDLPEPRVPADEIVAG